MNRESRIWVIHSSEVFERLASTSDSTVETLNRAFLYTQTANVQRENIGNMQENLND